MLVLNILKGQKRPLSLFPLTFKKCKMSKRNGAVGKETVELTAAEPAEAGGCTKKVRVVESEPAISTDFKSIEEFFAFAVLPPESMVSTNFFHRQVTIKYLLGAKRAGADLFHCEVYTTHLNHHPHDPHALVLGRF